MVRGAVSTIIGEPDTMTMALLCFVAEKCSGDICCPFFLFEIIVDLDYNDWLLLSCTYSPFRPYIYSPNQ